MCIRDSSYLWLFPDSDIGLFVSMNSPGKEGAAGAIRSALFHQFADRYLPGTPKPGPVSYTHLDVYKRQGYGFADVASRKPVDPATTLFRPGSVSKLFTWTAVMQLVEAGKLDLDKDVNTYLDFKIPPFEGKPVTLRNICLLYTSRCV